MIQFILNNKTIKTESPNGLTVLDFVRYNQHLKGTKIGCREGDCGACTVLVGEIIEGQLRYRSATSCLMAMGNANGKHIVTIEGVNLNSLNPIQQAMADEGATQCGFCTPGFVMSLAGYCLSHKEASPLNAIACMDGNICRCTGYKSIERAAIKVNELLQERNNEEPAQFVVTQKILPHYFTTIKERLQTLNDENNPQPIDKTLDQPFTFLSGGTDLYVQKHDSMPHAKLNLLFDKMELNGIYKEVNNCFVGAAATVTDLCESPIIQKHFPYFNRYAKLISSTPIRNMATLAGNFVNASPIGDFTILFLALDAQLILSDGVSKRELPLRKFYSGYKTFDKTPEEFIQQFYFKLPDSNTKFNFEKVSKRTHLDIASVNTAIKLTMDESKISQASISAGGVFAYPKYLEKTSAFLSGKNIDKAHLIKALEIAQTEIAPISDVRGSEEYKRLLLSQLIKAHFVTLFPGLKPEFII